VPCTGPPRFPSSYPLFVPIFNKLEAPRLRCSAPTPRLCWELGYSSPAAVGAAQRHKRAAAEPSHRVGCGWHIGTKEGTLGLY
jgi:hypothetical protein